MVTAFGREEVRDEAERLDIEGFLLKPVTKSMLVDTLVTLFSPESGETAAVTAQAVEQGVRLDGLRVVLVEDNEINQQVAVELIEGVGGAVTVASDGRQGVDLLEAAGDPVPYDVVLMDIQMPVMDGYQATARLRSQARFAKLPIVAMTAHATTEERQRCVAAGMNDHVAKPIDPPALYAVLGRYHAAARRRARRPRRPRRGPTPRGPARGGRPRRRAGPAARGGQPQALSEPAGPVPGRPGGRRGADPREPRAGRAGGGGTAGPHRQGHRGQPGGGSRAGGGRRAREGDPRRRRDGARGTAAGAAGGGVGAPVLGAAAVAGRRGPEPAPAAGRCAHGPRRARRWSRAGRGCSPSATPAPATTSSGRETSCARSSEARRASPASPGR